MCWYVCKKNKTKPPLAIDDVLVCMFKKNKKTTPLAIDDVLVCM